jgi:2-(1,2-epoxy-1,2-dihydrophenyl)acetyl-CoA isomerase
MSITVEHKDGIATVTLNRPDKLNALSAEMYHELGDIFLALNSDDQVRCVVLTGSGRAFCAGGDVVSMGSFDVVSGRKRSKSHHRMILNLHHLEKPVIASIRGPVAGIGASLALACDLIIASETAYFLMAFKNVGIPPDGGAIYFLTQHLGIARAKDIVFSARKLPATEAHQMGIVKQVVADDLLESTTLTLAQDLSHSATYALTLAKRMFQFMATPTLEQLLELEVMAICGARMTHDHSEGIAAFKEKRKPNFKGQ